MQNDEKTKELLIYELREFRLRVAESQTYVDDTERKRVEDELR